MQPKNEKTVQLKNQGADPATEAHESQTPWAHDEHRYALLVNVAANLNTYGWALFAVSFIAGISFCAVGFSAGPLNLKILAFAAGLAFILVGTVIKVVWHVLYQVIDLFIDVANDLHALRNK